MAEKALLLGGINRVAGEAFTAAGYDVEYFPKSVSTSELTDMARHSVILGVRSGPKVPSEVFESNDCLAAVGCFCVGTNHVDLKAANRNGVAVFNAPHENTRSVAEHVIATAMSLLRGIQDHNRSMHDGTWTKTEEGSYQLLGKTLGIIGHGTVGTQVSVLAEALGMRVLWYDPAPRIEYEFGNARRVSKKHVLAEADIVTLHVPGGRKVIGRDELFNQMKPGSYLINAARGDVVDYEAAAEAISEGKLAGLAVDVFESEPAERGDQFNHILRGLPGVLLTPHIAGSTVEAQATIAQNTATKILGYLATGASNRSLTLTIEDGKKLLPQPLEVEPGVTRILSIHRNISGALDHITHPIAENNLNISATGLATDAEIGYAYFDVDGAVDEKVLRGIEKAKENIRLRTIRG